MARRITGEDHNGASRAGAVEEEDSRGEAHADGFRLRGVRHRGGVPYHMGPGGGPVNGKFLCRQWQ